MSWPQNGRRIRDRDRALASNLAEGTLFRLEKGDPLQRHSGQGARLEG